jgi:hypothetical protein
MGLTDLSVDDYVNQEYTRLANKKKTVDDLYSAQKRAIILNESYRKRFSRYTQIVMIISLVVIIYLGILSLRKMMPAIPEMVTDILLAVVFFVAVVWCITIILETMKRSVSNYDELDLPGLVTQDK